MNKTLLIILVVVAICVALALVTTRRNIERLPQPVQDVISKLPMNNEEPVLVEPEDLYATIDSNNKLAIELYKEINIRNKNTFYSPYSMSTALAMVYEGSKGNTAKELENVFGYQTNSTSRHESFSYLYKKLNNQKGDSKISTANALWIQKDYPLLSEYRNAVKTFFGGESEQLDFANQTENSRTSINIWVENNTQQKIKDLLPRGSIKNNTRFVLTNAIYFNGKWETQFDKELTKDRNFTTEMGTIVSVPMMFQESKQKYAEVDNIQILQLPYTNNDLAMTILLPRKGEMAQLEKSLTTDAIAKWQNQLREQKINIYIPKFKTESSYDMITPLMELGVKDLFDSKADLSGINGRNDLFVSGIFHKAYIDVYEEGTEAAAATAVVGSLKSSIQPSPVEFIADHPFIFMIQDTSNGSILFMGKIADPKL